VAIPDLQGVLWAWVQTLPPWQSDLLRRLTTLDDVAEADLDDATRMVLAAHGIPDTGGPAPIPIPTLVGPAEPRMVGILALKELVDVGSVEEGQRLDFAATGLTVVYGETGSGKSSYARVLRKACRSSAKPIEILPNVLNTGPGAGNLRAGTAQLEISIDGATTLLTRDVNAPPERDLAEVSVFDSDCADVYADEESEITYTPSALRLLERLVSLQTQIRKRIDDQIATLLSFSMATDGFDASTKAGALALALNENVSPATVDKLADLSAEELAKLEDLRGKIAAAKVNDPARTAALLDKRANAIDELATTLEQRASRIDERAVSDLLALHEEIARLSTAADELARLISHTSTFPVGGHAWRAMWTAAQTYVQSLSDGGLAFPPGSDVGDAHCPLCQQALTPEARRRLDRFEEHARGQVQKALDAARVKQKERIDDVASAAMEVGRSAQVGAVVVDAIVEASVVAFNQGTRDRAQAIARTGTEAVIDAPPLPPSPIAALRDLAAAVRRNAAEQRTLANPDMIARAAREIAELDNRLLLAKRRDLVVARINALKRAAKLKQAFSALATTGLSKRIGDFTENAVTEQLRARLATELAALGGDHIPVRIGARGAKGKTKVSLRLDASRPVDVGDVLSEGERRAVALAFFLAEVAVAEHGGGVVLDDPVSSLDHYRRSYVAKRLIEESARRQVIVFTHDVVFLLELQEQARLEARACETRVVRRVGTASGIASKELPWVAQNVKARIGYLKGEMQRLSALERKGDAEVYRRQVKVWFELLREAWERAVEEKLFAGVVGRFQPGIQTLRLSSVKVTPEMTAAVERGMTQASAWTHDQAPALGKPPPTANDLTKALGDLETFSALFKT